jgi:hypothetical protein
MEQKGLTVSQVEKQAKLTAKKVGSSPLLEKLARSGYAARGVVYVTIGLLAAQVSLGIGGQFTNIKGALKTIMMQPFGEFIVIAIAASLVGYAIWRFVQAILDPEYQEFSPKRIIPRLGFAVSGLTHVGLAIAATKILTGLDDGETDEASSIAWTAKLLAQPFGRWLVVGMGVSAIAVSLSYFYRVYKADFQNFFKLIEMSKIEQVWAIRLGRLGFTAQGAISGVIGSFLIQAALQYDPEAAKGLEGALEAIARQPFGLILLGIVALGLIAYGSYELVLARYRRIAEVVGEKG